MQPVTPVPECLGDGFAALVDAAPMLVAAADRYGRIVLFNAACEALTGLQRNDVVGESFVETLVPEDWHEVVRERFAGDSPAALSKAHVNPWRSADGEARSIEWHCFLFESPDLPNCPWIVGIGHDITTLEQTRAQVAAHEQLIDALFEHIPEGITIADAPDVSIRRVSRFGETIAGRTRQTLEGIPADKHPDTWALFHTDGVTPATPEELPLTRATQEGEVVTDEEWIIRRPDGSDVTILCNAGPLRDDAGKITGGLIAWRDITRRKHLEDELRAANLEKDQFLAAVAHELRQPVAASIAALAMLRLRDSTAADQTERAVGVLERQLRQMTRLVEDLLDTSHVARDAVPLSKERLNLCDLARESMEGFREAMDAHGHQCSLSVPPEPVFVHADRMRLQQVFNNLLGNAAKYTPDGGTIQLLVFADTGGVRISVRDNGLGIPEHAQQRIFDLFGRADTSVQGFGIGLAVVRRLVEAHGGSVSVRSDGPGQGSEFLVTLPAASV